jgi:hypothetical protein
VAEISDSLTARAITASAPERQLHCRLKPDDRYDRPVFLLSSAK